MKRIIITLIFTALLSGSLTLAQNIYAISSVNEYGENFINNVSASYDKPGLSYLKSDINRDGKIEILSGGIINKVSENEYWVKNTVLKTGSGDEYFFNNYLLKNNIVLIDQIKAENGYILVFKAGSPEIEVYIASDTGEKFSDAIVLNL